VRRVTAIENEPRVATVGAGASTLVAELLLLGHRVTAVDIAPAALDALVAGIPEGSALVDAGRLMLVVADVRSLQLDEPVHVWHDRAAFHFLVDSADRDAYVRAATAALRPGGHLVIATFAPGGPESCSGLRVVRHDADSLRRQFAGAFEMVEAFELDHLTPWSTSQRFTHAVFRRI
jgi:SAM-dependent methyltransferase